MKFFEIFVHRPVMAMAVNLVLLVAGLVSYHHLELRHTSGIQRHDILVNTQYPGANALAVEHQVTKPLEDALSGLDGIKKLSSTSQDGRSYIHIKFKHSVNSEKVLGQVRDRVLGALSSLPESVKRPEIQERGEEHRGIVYIKFEDQTRSIAALSDYIKRVVEDRLRLIEGVAEVGHFGDKLYLIAIKPDPALLMEHGVTVKEVVDALHREKAYASGGEIEGITSKESVVLTAMVEKPEDFQNVTIKMDSEGRVTVGNVATVSVSEKPTFARMRDNGQEAIGIEIIPKPQANPLEVVKRVHGFVADLKKTMPSSMSAVVTFDVTKPFAAAFVEMRHTLWEAIALVGIVVVLSLASVRAALLPMVTVPLCLVGVFSLMWLLGFSLNPVTLLALVLAVGLVVDDAIVVVENIYRHMEQGVSAFHAATKSMKEISFAVIVMTITLAAVYLPLIFQIDASAIMFREFAWTLAGSVLISGFVALTLTPALGGKFLKDHKKVIFWEKISTHYQKNLKTALMHPGKICFMLIFIAILGIIGFRQLPSELKPAEDEGYFQGFISSDNPVSTPVKEDWFRKVEAVLNTVPERERVFTGIWQEQWMFWNLILKPSEERRRTAREIIADLRPKLDKIVGPMVGVFDNFDMGDGDESLKIVIQYVGNQEKLVQTIDDIMFEVRKLPGISSVMSEESWQKPRLKVVVDRELAAELGVSVEAIEDTLDTFLSGRKAADFNFQGFDYDVEVRAPLEIRSEIDNLNSYFVASVDKKWVPLGSLVTLKEVLDPTNIKHYDRMRGAAINISLKENMPLPEAMKALESVVQKYLPKDARFYFSGKAEKYRESQVAMWLNFGLAITFIYLVLAALFESFVHPFVVLLTVPLSITGAVWGLYGIGGTSNMYTSIGLVTLIGLITKHGILIVDFANRLRLTMPLQEAILSASASRLRPVLMTTLAMIFGAIPLMFSVGTGAIARKDIGVVIIAGMLMGTLFSLFVVPVAYLLAIRLTEPKVVLDLE